MSGSIVTNLPDDDEPPPRRKPAIDEVHEAHAAAGEALPPLSATSHLNSAPAAPTNSMGAAPLGGTSPMGASPMGSPMNSGMNSPMGSPMSSGMNSPMGSPMNSGMGSPMGSPLNSGMGSPMGSGIGGPICSPMGSALNNSSMGSPMGGAIPGSMAGAMGGGYNTMGVGMMNQQAMATTAQAQASVGLAQTQLDQTLLQDQLKKEDEHWVKSYWRPAMGWLYMLICFMDFVGFPAISMFLPVVMKGFGVPINYVAWQSLTLSNGGLIHLAFGGILGVAAFTRGQEKLASMK